MGIASGSLSEKFSEKCCIFLVIVKLGGKPLVPSMVHVFLFVKLECGGVLGARC